jgi:hypothetical protein
VSRDTRPVCADCPFNTASIARDHLRTRVDDGAWLPCRHTQAALQSRMTYGERISAWLAEEECVGARLWRRDRQSPAAAGTAA